MQSDEDNECSLPQTAEAELDDEVLRSLGSVEGEELLAFFDNVRSTYQLNPESLDLPQVIPKFRIVYSTTS